MTVSAQAAPRPLRNATDSDYIPGVCNIGPAEIRRRRRAGDIAALATIVVFVVLVALQAPPWARLLVSLPAMGAASGYLQAWLKFCAGFGSLGVFNFGVLGSTVHVEDSGSRSRDRARARQIGAGALVIGLFVGALAALLPV